MPTRNTETYLRVLAYFQNHLCATSKEAAAFLDVDVSTVRRYVRLIRADWRRPEPPILDPAAMEARVRNLEKILGRLLEAEL